MDTQLTFSTETLFRSFPFVNTKLNVPNLPVGLVERPRLTGLLNQSVQHKLLLLSAPAGFGKTTLLSDWAGRSEWPVAWVSLDAADNDPLPFWSYVITALDKVEADIEHILDLLNATHVDTHYILTGLINALAGIADDFVLVLDDYHCIENEDTHQALAFLIDYMPDNMHLILAGRVDPPLPLARWRGRSQMLQIGGDDLRFSPDETQTLLRQAVNRSLPADAVNVLQQRTEGWAAGLHLAVLTVDSASGTDALPQDFGGDHRYIVDYLASEVLQQQPESIRNFLLNTAIVEYLDSGLCNALTGREDSEAILAEIEQRNLFIVSCCPRQRTYRYHHLFADFLRSQLQKESADQLPGLHRQAAVWYQAQGDVNAAIKHTLAAGDFAKAADLVEQVAKHRLILGEFNTLLGWFSTLPPDVIQSRPKLCLFYAWTLTHAGHFDEADEYLNRLDPFDADEFVGGIAAIRARMAGIRGQPDRIIEFSREALAHLPADLAALRSEISLDLAFAQDQLATDLDTARQAFEEAIACNQSANHPRAAIMAGYYLAMLYVNHGQLQPAAQVLQQALQWAQRHKPPVMSICWAYVGLGHLLYEWNRLDEAFENLQQALQLAQQSGEVKVLIYSHRTLARLYQIRNEMDKAQTALSAAENVIGKTNIVSLVEDVALEQLVLWLNDKQLDTAAGWVQARGYRFDFEHPESKENTMLIRLTLAQSTQQNAPPPDEVIPLLQQRCDHEQRIGHTWQQLQNLVLLAVAQKMMGNETSARETFRQALLLAQPAGFIRALVDEGPVVAELFHHFVNDDAVGDYAADVLSAFGDDQAAPPRVPQAPVAAPPLVEPLRQRELEVLHHISQGYSNQEIADEMVLAVSTVKWHLKNIYGKLQVNRRTQAVARAKELSLL